ncbi:MAG: dienelactone hydrolase family protein [Opitutae bacterium]|nr:dienelactone hydrolase family protein [Opitutae bacterium]
MKNLVIPDFPTGCAALPVAQRVVHLPVEGAELTGDLVIPAGATGVVLFAHGSGSSRYSPRNQHVARMVQDAGMATILFDLLTDAEEEEDAFTNNLRFNIELLAARLVGATRWVRQLPALQNLGIGYFGASTGAAAALVAAAELPDVIRAVVSRGGRPDLAGPALRRVSAPTLLIVGGQDHLVIQLNREACARLRCAKRLVTVPGATHLFEETGALDQVGQLAAEWFKAHLSPAPP